MNKIGSLILGIFIGGGLSALVTNLLVKDKYEKITNEEIDRYKKHKDDKLKEELKCVFDAMASDASTMPQSDEEVNRIKKELNALKEKYGTGRKEKNSEEVKKETVNGKEIAYTSRKTNYNSYCSDKGPVRESQYDITNDPGAPPEGDDSDTYDVDLADTMSYEANVKRDPGIYIIDSYEYSQKDACDFSEYFYYSGNDIVTDGFDNEVTDWEDYIGTDWIEELLANDSGVIYILNSRISMKYEVILIDGEFTPKE